MYPYMKEAKEEIENNAIIEIRSPFMRYNPCFSMDSAFYSLAFRSQDILENELERDPYNSTSLSFADSNQPRELLEIYAKQASILAGGIVKDSGLSEADVTNYQLAYEEYLIMSNSPFDMEVDLDFSLPSVSNFSFLAC